MNHVVEDLNKIHHSTGRCRAVNQVVFLRALEDLERWDRLRVVGDFHGNTIAMMHVANRWNRQIEVFLLDSRVNQQPDVPAHTVHCFAANHFSIDAWPEAVTVIEQVRPRARAMSDRISVGVCGDKFTPFAVIVECVHQIQQSLEQQCEIVVRPHPFVLQQRGVRAWKRLAQKYRFEVSLEQSIDDFSDKISHAITSVSSSRFALQRRGVSVFVCDELVDSRSGGPASGESICWLDHNDVIRILQSDLLRAQLSDAEAPHSSASATALTDPDVRGLPD